MPYELVGFDDDDDLVSGANLDLIGADMLVGNDDDVDAILSGAGLRSRATGLAASVAKKLKAAVTAQAAAKAKAFARANMRAVQEKKREAAVVVEDRPPTKSRIQIMGMVSSGTVAALASQTITARPQGLAFKPTRIAIPSTIASLFTVDEIKVGNVSQLPAAGSIPGEAFLPDAEDMDLDFDTVQTSQDFILVVTNLSGGAVTFRAAIRGRAVQ